MLEVVGAGANLVAAIRAAARLSPNQRVTTLMCGSGPRYLAGEVFDVEGRDPTADPPSGQVSLGCLRSGASTVPRGPRPTAAQHGGRRWNRLRTTSIARSSWRRSRC